MRPQDVASAFKAFQAAKEQDTVSEEEFQRRFSICQSCPQRKKGIRTIKTRISKILADYSNRHAVRKEITEFSCGVCSCHFGLLLPAKPEHLHVDSEEEAKKRPDFCWAKK